MEGHTFSRVGTGGVRVVLRNVEFTMRCELVGPWFLGRQKIEARGQIAPATRAWARKFSAAAGESGAHS